MKAIDILHNLQPYQKILNEIHEKENAYLIRVPGFTALGKKLICSYDFIKLEMSTSESDSSDSEIYCSIIFEVQNGLIVLNKIHCEEPSRIQEMEKIIKENRNIYPAIWNSFPDTIFYESEMITNYLDIADKIAEVSHNCCSGDSYRPGYFSEINITEEGITLSQINYMNSSSIDHKNDYSMRKLILFIPFKSGKKDVSGYDYSIGEMLIKFSDSSSKNNKACGAAIAEKIKEIKENYDSK